MNASQAGLVLDIVGVLILALKTWSEFRVTGPRSFSMGGRLTAPFWTLIFFLGYPFLLAGFVLQYIGSTPKANASLSCTKANSGAVAIAPNGEKILCQNGVLWIPAH